MDDPVPFLGFIFVVFWVVVFTFWKRSVGSKVILLLVSLLLLSGWKVLAVYVPYGIFHFVYPPMAIILFVILVYIENGREGEIKASEKMRPEI